MPVSRRTFLTGAGAAVAAGAAAADRALEHPPAAAVVTDPHGTLPAVPFHGAHQAGITTPKPPAATFAAFNVLAANRSELGELLKELTGTARRLTAGGEIPDPQGRLGPPADSGTLGTVIAPDALTVTVGVGASLFDSRYGLSALKPRRLTGMHPFPDDDLDPAQTGGDLLLQICAGSPDTVAHAIRLIAKRTRGLMQIAWKLDGTSPPTRPTGAPRNHFGFNDGIANPTVTDPAVADRLLWVTEHCDEPAWAVGGSYHVVRIIQMLTEFWDRVSLNEQQQMIGRSRASGAPLGSTSPHATPDYASDPHGQKVPLTAHMRLANPRTPATEDSRIYRRGFNYARGLDLNGNLDLGLIFNCFQQDLERQFIATQRRLIGEGMVDYITPVGGGYFFALPGVRSARDWYGRALLNPAAHA